MAEIIELTETIPAPPPPPPYVAETVENYAPDTVTKFMVYRTRQGVRRTKVPMFIFDGGRNRVQRLVKRINNRWRRKAEREIEKGSESLVSFSPLADFKSRPSDSPDTLDETAATTRSEKINTLREGN